MCLGQFAPCVVLLVYVALVANVEGLLRRQVSQGCGVSIVWERFGCCGRVLWGSAVLLSLLTSKACGAALRWRQSEESPAFWRHITSKPSRKGLRLLLWLPIRVPVVTFVVSHQPIGIISQYLFGETFAKRRHIFIVGQTATRCDLWCPSLLFLYPRPMQLPRRRRRRWSQFSIEWLDIHPMELYLLFQLLFHLLMLHTILMHHQRVSMFLILPTKVIFLDLFQDWRHCYLI